MEKNNSKRTSSVTIILLIIIAVILLVGGILLYSNSKKIAELEEIIQKQPDSISEQMKDDSNEHTPSTDSDDNEKMDAGLEKAARIYLELDEDCELTDELFSNVLELDLTTNEIKIESFAGIEKFINLETFRLGECCNISDISPLSKLTQIRVIEISNNYIEVIPDFSNCTKLETLYLPLNKIKDISPIKDLNSLRYLSMNSNFITSVEPLKGLSNLEYLDMDNNAILDWNTLNGNKSIQNALQWDFKLTAILEKESDDILNRIIKPEMTELEKELVIYKYVMDNTTFNSDYRNPKPAGYRAICENKGVCGEYAEAVAYLMNKAGIECIIVGSDTHTWNMVKINNVWYEIDATWDDNSDTVNDWIYFNVSRGSFHDSDHELYIPERYPETNTTMPQAEYIKAYNNIK